MHVLTTAPAPLPHRYVSSLEERLQNFGTESKAKMDAVQKDFDLRAAAAEAEALKLRRRVADLEAEMRGCGATARLSGPPSVQR